MYNVVRWLERITSSKQPLSTRAAAGAANAPPWLTASERRRGSVIRYRHGSGNSKRCLQLFQVSLESTVDLAILPRTVAHDQDIDIPPLMEDPARPNPGSATGVRVFVVEQRPNRAKPTLALRWADLVSVRPKGLWQPIARPLGHSLVPFPVSFPNRPALATQRGPVEGNCGTETRSDSLRETSLKRMTGEARCRTNWRTSHSRDLGPLGDPRGSHRTRLGAPGDNTCPRHRRARQGDGRGFHEGDWNTATCPTNCGGAHRAPLHRCSVVV